MRVNTVTDYGVHLGAYVETKNSNFARGNTVSHLTYIGDSDVGKYCNFGCGTVTCNYDGKDKFRTQIGDYCFIGCNTNLVAPVKVGDGAYTAAGSTITKDVPAQALGIARERQTNLDGWAEPKMEAYIAKKQKLESSRTSNPLPEGELRMKSESFRKQALSLVLFFAAVAAVFALTRLRRPPSRRSSWCSSCSPAPLP